MKQKTLLQLVREKFPDLKPGSKPWKCSQVFSPEDFRTEPQTALDLCKLANNFASQKSFFTRRNEMDSETYTGRVSDYQHFDHQRQIIRELRGLPKPAEEQRVNGFHPESLGANAVFLDSRQKEQESQEFEVPPAPVISREAREEFLKKREKADQEVRDRLEARKIKFGGEESVEQFATELNLLKLKRGVTIVRRAPRQAGW